MTAAIEVAGLWLAYPGADTAALRDVAFSVQRGELMLIAGPSGAGKSTLCSCLRGLVPNTIVAETRGQVKVAGRQVLGPEPVPSSDDVALVLQDAEAQIIGMSVEDDLAFGPENYGVPAEEIRARISEVLDLVGLRGLEKRDTYALSGGQKQRLAIASALMIRPAILILDEPTSELDPVGKAQVLEIISNLRTETSTTVVIVEHEIGRFASVADTMLLLDHGAVAAYGNPASLVSDIELFERVGGERPPPAAELARRMRDARLVECPSYGLDLGRALADIERELESHGSCSR
ncbi:MAG TPA: ABC transporter ATP-binding protein [Streptosporangiaceae bacterium]|nr:ABC transporter ATP-binding protein [Streptosporangiaceae bacterium]